MKKVLIITNLFHASPRIPGLCKYIREFGWEPVLLTTPLGENPEKKYGPTRAFTKEFRTIEVDYFDIVGFLKELAGFRKSEGSRVQLEKKLGGKSLIKAVIKKILVWVGAVIAYPDEMRGWRKPAMKKGSELLEKEKFSALLTSSSPVTSHLIARALKKSKKLPWLADLRDLWTQNHAYPFPSWRKFFETRLEKRILRNADALSTVSEGTAEKLTGRYAPKPVSAIHNGFDPETINEPAAPLIKKFTITYTGQIYQNKQDPKKFFAAVKELIKEKKIKKEDVEINIYGGSQAWIDEAIAASGIEDFIIQHGVIPRDETFQKQRESQLLLMFGWEDEYELGVFPTKLFEYFASRRPILATGGTKGEEFRKLITETNSGKCAIKSEEIKRALREYYHEYVRGGKVSFRGNLKEMEKYSYRSMAKKFAEILDKISK